MAGCSSITISAILSPIGCLDSIRRAIQPKPGRLVLFPSYMWHGTIPFHADAVRTTIAFDVVPNGGAAGSPATEMPLAMQLLQRG